MRKRTTVPIEFNPGSHIVEASHHETWLEAALRIGINVAHSCGGNGTCGTCRVRVQCGLGLLPARNELEAELATARNFDENERLCCQNFVMAGLTVEIPVDYSSTIMESRKKGFRRSK